MLGALFGTGQVPMSVETVKTLIRERFAAKAADVNLKAFDVGYETIKKQLS
jgi:Pyruvate/2-oxoacid:ferredoxin oxidoreductase gamma subunit